MAQCSSVKDNAIIKKRIYQLLDGIDMSNAKARLVYSFPRTSNKERGGYGRLASVVRDFYCELDPGSDYESHDQEKTDCTTIEEGSILYATSGSFGNI